MYKLVIWLLFVTVASPAYAQTLSAHLEGASPFMRTFGDAQPPSGFEGFCRRHPRECEGDGRGNERIPLNRSTLQLLQKVNIEVNAEIEPITDFELYGMNEFWTIPRYRGDCEDIALLKRQRLLQYGFPVSAVLMTVVEDPKGQGHAVLTVRTKDGDLILDNLTNEILPWYKTPHTFETRQSSLSPTNWVRLQ